MTGSIKKGGEQTFSAVCVVKAANYSFSIKEAIKGITSREMGFFNITALLCWTVVL